MKGGVQTLGKDTGGGGEEKKLVLSPKLAPGSFSAAVLVKSMLSFFFFLWILRFLLK